MNTQGPDIPHEDKGQLLEAKRLEEGRNEWFELVVGVTSPPQVEFQYDDGPVDSVEDTIKLISSKSSHTTTIWIVGCQMYLYHSMYVRPHVLPSFFSSDWITTWSA